MTASYDGHLVVREIAREVQVFACCRQLDEAVMHGYFIPNRISTGPCLLLPPNGSQVVRKIEICPFCGARAEQ